MRGLFIFSAVVVLAFAGRMVGAGETEGRAGRGVGKMSTFSWNADVEYPELGHPEMDARIREWLNGHVAECLDETKDFSDVGDAEFSWTMSIDYGVTEPSERAASVVFTTYTYLMGAAHPLRARHALSFDAGSGAVLSLDDLFADPEKALAIFSANAPRLVMEMMKAEYPDSFEGDADPMQAFFWDGFEPTRDNYAVFGLEPEGIRVYFQLYQVLPYVFGMPEALFTLDMLEEAGPKTEYWGQ